MSVKRKYRVLSKGIRKERQVDFQQQLLKGLSTRGFFLDHVFHGGTCLFLVYNHFRWSEDLDFVCRKGSASIFDSQETFQKFLQSLRPVVNVVQKSNPDIASIDVKLQKQSDVLVRIQFRIGYRDLREKIRVNFEVANVPAYLDKVCTTRDNTIIRAEQLVEILADKIVSIGARLQAWGEPKIRDIIDLYFLLEQNRLHTELFTQKLWSLVDRKLGDYGIDRPVFVETYRDKLERWLKKEDTVDVIFDTINKYLFTELPEEMEHNLAENIHAYLLRQLETIEHGMKNNLDIPVSHSIVCMEP